MGQALVDAATKQSNSSSLVGSSICSLRSLKRLNYHVLTLIRIAHLNAQGARKTEWDAKRSAKKAALRRRRRDVSDEKSALRCKFCSF